MIDNNNLFQKNYNEKVLSLSALENLKKAPTANTIEIKKYKKLETKKISIIILTHNRFTQLMRLLNSIYSQKYSNYEIIIIDDVSTDETYDYLKNIHDDRLKYIRNETKIDIGINRQTAYNLATGDYVVFCDDDDYYIDDNYFSDIVKIFKDKEINVICSHSYIYYENNNQYEEAKLNFEGKIESLKYLERFQFDLKKPTSTFPMIARKSSLDKADLKNMKMMNDSSIYLRALMIGGYTYVNNKIIGVYRVHNSNISHSIKSDFIIKNLEEKKYVYNYLKNQNVNFDLDQWLENEVRLTIMYYFNGSEKSKIKRQKLLLWVLKNVSLKLYRELSVINRNNNKKENTINKLDIIKCLCIIVILIYNAYIITNDYKWLSTYINIIALYPLFIVSGYSLFKKGIRKVLHELKKIIILLVTGITLSTIYLIFKNNMPPINLNLFNNLNVYNGLSILLLLSCCFGIEVVKRITKKSLEIIEIITLIIIVILTKNIFFICIMLYIIGRSLRKYAIIRKIKKKHLLLVISTIILYIGESIIFKNNINIFAIILSIELVSLIIRINRLRLGKLKIFSKRVLLYILSLIPVISIISIDIHKDINSYIYPIITILATILLVLPFYIINKIIKKNRSKKRKKCLVIGYMNNNFGDDLFFKILFDRYKNVDFYMYPPSHLLEEYQEKFLRNKNVIFYEDEEEYLKLLEYTGNDNKDSKDIEIDIFPLICERAKKVDFYVNIGGSIFIQNDNWKDDDRFKLKEIMQDKPSFIIGCNFGPGDDEYYNYYKNWFKGFSDICFRDKESYQKFKDLENTRLADDIVLVYTEKHKFHPIGYNKTIGISVLNPENTKKLKKYSKNYYNFIISTIKYYISIGFNIKIYVFCINEGDLEAAQHVVNKLTDSELKHLKVISYKKKINKFIREWKKSKYIIGTRFHSNILAIAHGQSFLPIVYSDKTYNYLKNIDDDIEIYDIVELEKMKKDKIVYNNVVLNYSSEDQFIILDNYVKGKSK